MSQTRAKGQLSVFWLSSFMSIHRFHPRFPYPPIINDYREVQTVPLCCGSQGGSVLTLFLLSCDSSAQQSQSPFFPSIIMAVVLSLTRLWFRHAASKRSRTPMRDGIHLCHPPKNSKQPVRRGWCGRESAVSAAFCTFDSSDVRFAR